eukprot:67051-Chlamydomonas_euryale.AAC.3
MHAHEAEHQVSPSHSALSVVAKAAGCTCVSGCVSACVTWSVAAAENIKRKTESSCVRICWCDVTICETWQASSRHDGPVLVNDVAQCWHAALSMSV